MDTPKRVILTMPHPDSKVSGLLEREKDAHPYWPDVQNTWGLLCLSRGDARAAREAFEEALSINPKYGWASLNLAAALILEGRVDEAWVQFERNPDPETPGRDLTEGWLAVACGDRDRAMKVCARLADLANRADLELLAARITGTPPAGGASPAVNVADETNRLLREDAAYAFPGLYQLWLAASRIQARLGDAAGAQGSARTAFALFSDLGRYLNHQGYLASLQGEDEEARGFYEQAVPVNRQDPTAPAALARHWSVQDDLDRAVMYLEEALRRAPRYADLLRLMGQLQAARGNQEGALAYSRRALEINPRYRSARIEEANALFLLNRWQDAALTYRNLVREGFRSSDILLHLGRCEEECGRFRDAERAYLESVDMNPEELLSHYRLSILYRKLGQPEAADQAWKVVVDLNRRPEIRNPVESLIESPGFTDEDWPLPTEHHAA